MAAIVTQQDIDFIRSLYPGTDFKYLTGQEEQMLLMYFRGMNESAAARAAGYSNFKSAKRFLSLESTQKILEYLREREFSSVRVTQETITGMLFEAHRKSANSMEEIAAIKELAKIHKIYPDQKSGGSGGVTINNVVATQVTENGQTEKMVTRRQIEQLPDSELLTLAGGGFDFRLPEPEEAIDCEYIEVDESEDR